MTLFDKLIMFPVLCKIFLGCTFLQLATMAVRRLTAPKDIQTSDLESVLERYFTMKGNRDLSALLSNLHENTTWKNAPKPSCLAAYSSLYTMFVALSPQGVLPAKNSHSPSWPATKAGQSIAAARIYSCLLMT